MSFEVVPAVDIKGGRCVRLLQGRAEAETVFGDDAVAMARRWQAAGAPRLHVVDLDGAFAGRPSQTALVADIIGALTIPVEVGGGLRELSHVEAVLEAGARWAIVGTSGALEPPFLGEVCRRFEDRIIVLARDAAAAGAAAVIYTDIARDGTEGGPNVWSTAAVAVAAGIPVFASGGVGSLADIHQLAAVPGLAGVIVGRALYSGAVDLGRALAEVG
jgi:phosphoribosylformimino-5-aminoimidazole carboxamide ribotide isomerase